MKATAQAATNFPDIDEDELDARPKVKRVRARKAANAAGAGETPYRPVQLDLFALLDAEPEDVPTLVALADQGQDAADAVLAENAELVAALEDGGRDHLGFAHFMQAANVPMDDVRDILGKVTEDADAVMEALSMPGEQDGEELEDGEAQDEKAPAARRRGRKARTPGDDDTSAADSSALFRRSLRGPRHAPPTPEHEAELGRRIRAGDIAARNELVDRNMRMVVSIAARYLKTGRPFDDIIQAGAEGLMTAADKFDPSIARFTTVATWWVKQHIQRAIRADATMPMPNYLPYEETKLLRKADEATSPEEKGRLLKRARAAAEQVESRRAAPVSLDAKSTTDEGDGRSAMDELMHEGMGPEEQMERVQLIEKLRECAEGLSDSRARGIFMMRVGLHPDHPGNCCTLAEAATVYDLSRERVRQIYTQAAAEVANAMEVWAKGAQNLPTGFRKGLMVAG